MSFGLQVFRENGQLAYSSAMTAWNLVDVFYFLGLWKVTRTYTGLSQFEKMATMLSTQPTDITVRDYTPVVTFDGDDVLVSPNPDAESASDTKPAYIYIFAR